MINYEFSCIKIHMLRSVDTTPWGMRLAGGLGTSYNMNIALVN